MSSAAPSRGFPARGAPTTAARVIDATSRRGDARCLESRERRIMKIPWLSDLGGQPAELNPQPLPPKQAKKKRKPSKRLNPQPEPPGKRKSKSKSKSKAKAKKKSKSAGKK